MPPVECTSLANGAEAPQYQALSPLIEDYYPFMDYNNHPLMYRQEVFLSSAALPDTPNPLNINMNYDCPESFTGFNFDPHYANTNDNFHHNSYIEETSNIFKSSCDVLEGKDISNMALQSTANNKEIPVAFLVEAESTSDYIKKESGVSSFNKWSQPDVVEWLTKYGANREQAEMIEFKNTSELLGMLNSNPEEYAKILCMATSALLQACKSIENSAHPPYMQPGHLYVDGNHEMMHNQVKQESNSQLEYPSWEPPSYNYTHPEEYTSEEDPEEEPEKQEVVPRRTGKRGRPPNTNSKAAAKRKEKGHGKLWEFIRDLLKEPKYCPSLICWEDHDQGVFRFVSSEKVAKLWGDKRKNNAMNYEKLSRAMRYYYKSQILLPVTHRRLVYKFGPNAVNWRCPNPNFIHKS